MVYATRAALREAERRGLGVIETAVERSILEGRIVGHGEERLVRLEGGFVARTVTTKDRTAGGRRRLLVTRIEKAKPPRRTR